MKPFLALTVLVAASLTGASAAPAQQQQVAAGSGANGRGSGHLFAGGFPSHSGSQFGVGSPAGSLQGTPASGGSFGQSFGGLQNQRFPGVNYAFGPYQGLQRPGYYYPGGQNFGSGFYGPIYYGQGYGNNAGWVSPSVYGGNPWGSLTGYGSGFGYGSGYGGFSPAGFGNYGGYGSYGGFGSTSGFGGVSQTLASQAGSRPGASGSSSSLQTSAARSQ